MARVAVAQMLSGESLSANLSQAKMQIENAANEGAKLVVLPENFALLDSKALVGVAKQEQQSPQIMPLLCALAETNGIWIIAGSLPVLAPSGSHVYARCVVINHQGGIAGHYDKVHLFDVDVADKHGAYRESDFIAAGEQLNVVTTPFGNIGLSICYDLRFPEHYQRLRLLGAEIIIVPSAFTFTTGQAHWEVLLRARAIETQCYVLAPNQGGQHSPNRQSWGHSMIVDPWGEVLGIQKAQGSGLVFAEIDLEWLAAKRKAMPIDQHRAKAGF